MCKVKQETGLKMMLKWDELLAKMTALIYLQIKNSPENIKFGKAQFKTGGNSP